MSQTSTPQSPSPIAWRLTQSPGFKLALIGGLLLVMLVPLFMVSSLISEREARQADVLDGFQRGWGPQQSVAGPMLTVPYSYRGPQFGPDGKPIRLSGWARLAPTHLQLQASLQPETRRRGLFHAVVYRADVQMSGDFAAIGPIKGLPDLAVDWTGARVTLGATDLRGIAADPSMQWNGGTVPLDLADSRAGCALALLTAPAGLEAAPGGSVPFKVALSLRGTQAFRVVPFARRLTMQVAAPWATPAFVGSDLPLEHSETKTGFTAQWESSGDATSAGWQFRDQALPDCSGSQDAGYFATDTQQGVELQEAVPTYLMVERASKYSVLFLALSYLTLFLFETVAGVRIHIVQYGLLGLSVSLFALLLISVAEPLGFDAGYAVGTAAVLAQASLYILAVVRRPSLAAVFAGVLSGLFGFLYVLISLDAFALLVGSAALFLILSLVMVVTRHVNWNGVVGTPS